MGKSIFVFFSKLSFLLQLFFFTYLNLAAQNIIPEIIKEDLILKPTVKPYETSGFTVEKGAKLTIMPGVKIITISKPENYCIISIKGGIVIGEAFPKKGKPVIIQGYAPWLKFEGATLAINDLNITVINCQFNGDNTGLLSNSCIYRDPKTIPYPLLINVPAKGNLTITGCLIEDQGCEIKTLNFPNDIQNLTISKCAFTYAIGLDKTTNYYKKCSLSVYTFIYGTQCDTYANISFTPMDWKLKEIVKREWYIDDLNLRQTIGNSAKSVNLFNLKLGTNKFTTFKQTLEVNK